MYLEIERHFVFSLYGHSISNARFPFRHLLDNPHAFFGKQSQYLFTQLTFLVARQLLEGQLIFDGYRIADHLHLRDGTICIDDETEDGLSLHPVIRGFARIFHIRRQESL